MVFGAFGCFLVFFREFLFSVAVYRFLYFVGFLDIVYIYCSNYSFVSLSFPFNLFWVMCPTCTKIRVGMS